MNKIKLLYDVVKTMKGKDVLKGVATVEVQKNQAKLFYLKNEFEKNLLTMQTKANIVTELDYEGKQVKHQSNTELTNHCPGKALFQHLHQHDSAKCCCGWKGKLAKIAFVLSLLNNMQAEEKENKTALITLNLSEIPEDLKTAIHEKMNYADCCGHGLIKELCCVEKGNFALTMFISKNNEIEKVIATFDGSQNYIQGNPSEIKAKAELQLSW